MIADLTLANSRIAWDVDGAGSAAELEDPDVLLQMVPTERLAQLLEPLSWAERATWCDHAVARSLDWAARDIKSMRLKVIDARHLVMCVAEEIQAKLADVLDRLDQLGPLPLDEAAWRLYRVAGDPGRLEMARQHWRTRSAESTAMAASPGLVLLRDCLVALAAAERGRAPRRAMGGAR